jgi:hypothetical protein
MTFFWVTVGIWFLSLVVLVLVLTGTDRVDSPARQAHDAKTHALRREVEDPSASVLASRPATVVGGWWAGAEMRRA